LLCLERDNGTFIGSHLTFENCIWKTTFPIKKWSHGRNVPKKGEVWIGIILVPNGTYKSFQTS
jgi:hypothetical protein